MVEASTRVRLRVAPRSRRAEVLGRHGDAWKVRVREVPELGRANDAVVRLIAEELSLPREHVRLVSGHSAREKVVEIDGLDTRQAEERLERASEGRSRR